MTTRDFNQQLFASGQQQGALGCMGMGGDVKTSSLPLLAAVLPGGLGKDSKHGVFAGVDGKGFFSAEVNGIAGIFQPRPGDSWVKGLANAGAGGERVRG